jgi:hypothetical protein
MLARGDYQHAANEYKILASAGVDQLAWAGLASTNLRPTIWARVVTALELAHDDHELRNFLNHWIGAHPQELGPREHLAQLEARHGNYKAAFDHLAEEQAINPAHDQDWKATLLVALGTRADNNDRVAAIVQESIEKNPELWAIVQGIIEDYWPAIQRLADPAKQSFNIATRLLFDKTIGETAWVHAGFAASKAVELQLRSSVFDPYANTIRRTSNMPRRPEPGGRPEPLSGFVERGDASPLTMATMVKYLLRVVNPNEGPERSLRDWVKAHRPKLYGALTHGTLNTNDDIGALRNRATHEAITRQEALRLYKTSRKWLDEITKDR